MLGTIAQAPHHPTYNRVTVQLLSCIEIWAERHADLPFVCSWFVPKINICFAGWRMEYDGRIPTSSVWDRWGRKIGASGLRRGTLRYWL